MLIGNNKYLSIVPKSISYPFPLKNLLLGILIAIIIGLIFGLLGFTFIIGVIIAVALFLYIFESDSNLRHNNDK